MTNQRTHAFRSTHFVRLAPLAAAAALLATACGSSTTTTESPDDGSSVTTMAPPTTASPDATAPTTDPLTTSTTNPATTDVPSTDVTIETDVSGTDVPTDTDPDRPTPFDDAADDLTQTTVASCGSFGPIPPIPDSMPTYLHDTDGDGVRDDEVTAYGGIGGWRLRIVENGAVSEAMLPHIDGYAAITNDYQVHGRDYIEVTDADTDTIYTFATVRGCVELLDTRDPITDMATLPDDTVPGADVPECSLVEPVPAGATIESNVSLDLSGDGTADDQIVTYFDGSWAIRSTVDGITSEVGVAAVGPGAVRAVGVADVADLTDGNELIATVGAGAYTTQIGVYGLDINNCIFAFADAAGSVLTMSSGASISFGSGFSCGAGYIAENSWSHDDDDTFTVSGAAYGETVPGQFTFLPGSDDFAEGVSIDDLPSTLFDCNGLTL